jgi:UPF0755 protein
MKKFIAGGLIVLALLSLPVAAAWILLHQKALALEAEVVVEIPRGVSTRRIGELLEVAGLVRSPLEALAYRAFHPKSSLQAGEYVFLKERSSWEVLSKIARGEVYFRELTIPEGYSIFDLARLVDAEGLMSPADFLAAAKDPSLIRDLAPQATSLEGYLFPSTYRLKRRVTALDLCRRLTGQFRQVAKELNIPAGDLHSLVTLASLVEKESGVPEERPQIAGVFHNRLRLDMKLECDPTVIYAAQLAGRYRGTIYRSDLDYESPYNTYRTKGLPPGPIANPGKGSLQAALRPMETKAIFFVAEPNATGRHVFSETLADHNRAVEKYRSGLKGSGLKTSK